MVSTLTPRILDPRPVPDLAHYLEGGGGAGLEAARAAGPTTVLEMVDAARLRGRGGAGFPTADKWQTIVDNRSGELPATVVVNGAEGEPGSYKDRALMEANPYRVLEGAAIAASVVGADTVVVATKASFTQSRGRLGHAIAEMRTHPLFADGPRFEVIAGPDAYLFGEETALLEAIEGRPPFPRVGPPWRHGIDDAPETRPAHAEMSSPGPSTAAAPVLVNNVETLAHVTELLANGPTWFRETGMPDQFGTLLCTITGSASQHDVVEVPVGATLEQVLRVGRTQIVGGKPLGALPGASHPIVPADEFDRPLGYSGHGVLPAGSGAFRFFADNTDPIAIAAGVARFLAVESCGQCRPCKHDGIGIASQLAMLATADVAVDDDTARVEGIGDLLTTVADGARCSLARQMQNVVSDLLARFPAQVAARAEGLLSAQDPVLVAPVVALEGRRAQLDTDFATKQFDWSKNDVWNGRYPVDVHRTPAETTQLS